MMKSDFFNHLLNLTETCTDNKLKKISDKHFKLSFYPPVRGFI